MLKLRLIFGTLMTVLFAVVVIFDSWLSGRLTLSLQGPVLALIIAVLIIPAQLEFSALAGQKGIKQLNAVSIPASVLFATFWYWQQFIESSPTMYISFLTVLCLFALLAYQYRRYGTSAALVNCGVSLFSVFYLGLLGSFVLAVRIGFGPWAVLMFVFVVKSADIGAYTAGKLFGKHKFSPVISPAKTWEGMAGALTMAVLVSVLFAGFSGIMTFYSAVLFGLIFAFTGQLGDLMESMIKRDVLQKNSSASVPGFGGILDVLDSLLPTAPLAYVFFALTVT